MQIVTPPRPWLVLLGLALGVCVTNGFARFAYGLILPAMKSSQGWSYAEAGWLNTANALGYVFGSLFTALLIRRVGASRLFSSGVVLTAICLFATGLDPSFWAQSLWRILAGVFGAGSFVAGGALAAALFQDDPKRNALSIAFYFGGGGGLGIILCGATLPLMLEWMGPTSWPWSWIGIGLISFAICPLSIWAGEVLRVPTPGPETRHPVPARRMLGEFCGYAGFGLGYIVYLTFLALWMKERDYSVMLISGVWVLLGACITLSPFVWRSIFARYANGVPLAMILTGIAIGSALPIFFPTAVGVLISAVVFGLSVFMAPGAITNFTRKNMPQDSWGATISLFTVVFAVSQTVGPIGAGLIGDSTGDIGDSLLTASALLMLGAALAVTQKPLAPSKGRPH
ncbi:Major Facilitator Superfamily protein [Falsiruegeria litorea R37]|uniref:Major Facilitator Superfamily protein n=1 Tax=Falsiruegeria litorea R37 TaxID=1200284 RepID=A0A1Y5RLT8_9RHOB|nr:YbfB/YjiJ family MFS transporter [Falsiruegeria litorea]SLN20530.1 Major Facilitator Superfamily protein [Falsiruegeria litorea R37]